MSVGLSRNVPRHEVWLQNILVNGTTNAVVMRFAYTQSAIGTAITYVDDVSLGASFTINEDGVYAISFGAGGSAVAVIGITRNATGVDLTTTVPQNFGTDYTHSSFMIALMYTPAGLPQTLTTVKYLKKGDIIRAQNDGVGGLSFNSTNSASFQFRITKISE
jgi:hypothetical protein